MWHLDNQSGVPEMPEPKPRQSNSPRWFGESEMEGGISWPGADWFNIIQAELLEVLKVAGISPDKTSFDQISKAISIIGLNTSGRIARRASGASVGLFPRLMKKLTEFRHGVPNTQNTFRIYGFGSSVGVGATLPNPSANAPVMKFTELLRAALDPGSIYPIQADNYSVNGSTINQFNAAWQTATSDGIYPELAVFVYGMNDFPTANYNAGQTFGVNGFSQRLRNAIRTVQSAGGDVVLVTTPHPYIANYSWSMPTSVGQSWPSAVAAPVSDNDLIPPVSGSVASFSWNGINIQAAVRFLRGNDVIRKIATEMGCVLIDAERYWFDGVAKYGESELFDEGQVVHPNLLGHQTSFWAAFEDFCDNIKENGWAAPDASHPTLLSVGGSALYPNPTEADISLMATGDKNYAFSEYDRFARPLRIVTQDGDIQKYWYTSQNPTTGQPGYSVSTTEKIRRSGLVNSGEYVDFVVPQNSAAEILIEVFSSQLDTRTQTTKLLATNHNGNLTFSVIGENTSGNLFTTTAHSNLDSPKDAYLRVTFTLSNTVWKAVLITI
ncbi:hypothetical protein BIY29_02450 [Brenneria alni]|uniref:SGNH hydrolase-type esterase domain-containing protein n=1 Tax=Brenneria alni TaxID=71656 RepID=A0A421DSU0_9GAMM|nr:SGNH/GDSL hydrolase family protein [Brenneria alni]RLM27520.1 hypothetical protein BIY29_02450 [Brenneria alni]